MVAAAVLGRLFLFYIDSQTSIDIFCNRTTFFSRNHGQDSLQIRRRKGPQEGFHLVQVEEARRIVLFLHLQGVEAGAPRHGYLEEGYVYHELLH